jgi:hypothetical protein
LPDYYNLSKDNSELLPAKLPETTEEQKKAPKAKRPDDKIDRETKSLRRQNDRNLEKRQQKEGEKINDMFYKKESDRQIFSGTESEFEEIAEVKPKSKDTKILKITESDFENDILVKEKPKRKVPKEQNEGVKVDKPKRKNKLAEDSATELSDDDARFGQSNQQNRLQQRSKAMSNDDRLARSDGFN